MTDKTNYELECDAVHMLEDFDIPRDVLEEVCNKLKNCVEAME